MHSDVENAKENLAFLRSLTREAEVANEGTAFGVTYCAAGMLYGLQCIVSFVLTQQSLPASGLLWIIVGTLPTIIFLAIIFSFAWKNRSTPFGISASNRAISGTFASGGLTSIVLGSVFGASAYAQQSLVIWLMFPVVVCALQGGAWFIAAIVRRRVWYGTVSTGWFLSAILLGIFVQNTTIYLLILGMVLLMCMAIPGYIIVRSGR
ncbi:MAG: hypothetical protein AAFR21_05265 [Pseudomonadota bacterium]